MLESCEIQLLVCLSQNDAIKGPERLIFVAEDWQLITYGVLPWQKDITLQDGRFSKVSQFSNTWCFFERLFCTEQLWCSCRMVFRIFLAFLFFHPNWAFWKRYSLCMGYSPCKMANLQNCLISPIFGVLSRPYLHRTTLIFLHEYYVNCRHTNEMKMWSCLLYTSPSPRDA